MDNVNFVNSVDTYSGLIKTYSPAGFACNHESAEDLTDLFAKDANGISVWRCSYHSETGPMTVFHILVHMKSTH